MEQVRIPRHADEPPHLLLWSLDEVAPIICGMLFGLLISQVFICMVAGFFAVKFYKRFRDNHPDGFFAHLLYWSGIPLWSNAHFPNPMIRRFIP